MTRRCSGILFLAFLAGSCAGVAEREIVAERDGGTVRVRTHRDRQHVEVSSPKGIGAADVPLARPPLPLQLTFHLRALEQLRFTYDDVEVVVAVKPNGDVHEWVPQPGQESRALAAGDPLWMPVRIEREGAGAQAPIARIEIEGPAALRTAAPASFRIDWVDFFR